MASSAFLGNGGLNSGMGVMLEELQVTMVVCPLCPRCCQVGQMQQKKGPQKARVSLVITANQKLSAQEQSSDSQYVVTYTQASLGSLTGTFHSGFSCYCIGKTLGIWVCQARNLL